MESSASCRYTQLKGQSARFDIKDKRPTMTVEHVEGVDDHDWTTF